jgi:hypothetical protein
VACHSQTERLALGEIRRSAGDDGVVVSRIALRLGQRLPPPGRAAIEVRLPRATSVEGIDDGLGRAGHFMNRAFLEVDELGRVADDEVGIAASVSGVGARRRVTGRQRRRQRGVADRPRPPAVAH